MLEVRNLKKIYKTKNGADVNALDGVSISFPTTGMVFLLGKSGSGKSTLLNVAGGLDNPTEGEIIVKGRSSKDFSQSDFDSYRNTFIGFIFQEYNILNEFSVEDNIALALELQGKSKDKAAIAALLEEVDLKDFAKRKPNTLSGGQKQRIAIARALIKKPEIIMADEPTGALDSATGRQVFDTLKKLSETKLVIVVSHDRDFAELYGDRIIELCDGRVISDVSKAHLKQESISENMNAVGDVLCIKSGAELSEADFEKIKVFLKKSKTDVVIASDSADVSSFKKVARINDDGEKEVFADTDEAAMPKKEYTKEDSRFIRSKLPIRHAFKIGVSGLKLKPVRLFFTALLCTVAFVLFGLLSTLNFYNSEQTFRETLQDAEISALRINKSYLVEYTWYSMGEEQGGHPSFYDARFSPADIDEIRTQINPDAFGIVGAYGSFNLRQPDSRYWQNNITYFAFLPENCSLHSKITGSYPKAKNEMAITSYFADMFMACGSYAEDGTALQFTSYDEIIGRKIAVGGKSYKITGIIDSGVIPAEFDALKENTTEQNYALENSFYKQLDSGYHLYAFVNEDSIKEIAQNNAPYKEGRENYMRLCVAANIGGEYTMPDYSNFKYNVYSALDKSEKLYYLDGSAKEPSDGEVIVPSTMFFEGIGNAFSRLGEQASNSGDYNRAESYYRIADQAWSLSRGGEYIVDKDSNEESFIPLSDSEFESKLNALLKEYDRYKLDISFAIQLFNDANRSYIGEVKNFNAIALYRSDMSRPDGDTVYLGDAVANAFWDEQKKTVDYYAEVTSDYIEPADAFFSSVCLPGKPAAEKADALWEIYSNTEFDENSVRLSLTGGFVDSLRSVDSMISNLSKIFLYVGLVLAIFAALLLSNFISVSISSKKREIGILRAVGARSNDVFKIFFSESFVIGAICIVLSSVACSILCSVINKTTASELGASLFVFGIASFLVLVGIALVTIIVATFLPVYNAAKKKPVDSIRSL